MRYGHFDNEHREYCIDRVDLPVSWTNYIGTEEMCAVVNHTAGGYLFYQSPQYHRHYPVSAEWGTYGQTGTLCVSEGR